MLLRHQTTDKLSDLRFIGCRALGPFSFPFNTCLTNGSPIDSLTICSWQRFPAVLETRWKGTVGRWRGILRRFHLSRVGILHDLPSGQRICDAGHLQTAGSLEWPRHEIRHARLGVDCPGAWPDRGAVPCFIVAIK
jgi:hypothetical protein